MGKHPGLRQVTFYVDPVLYERVRCTAYTLGEDIYEFVGEALDKAIVRRTTQSQRESIDLTVSQNQRNQKNQGKNGTRHEKRR